ncbi:MAG: rod shape-determining protein MreD [Gammaproteobacteria bacterium]|nr:MAG: rod shape-determining protein MreD [Gammaproteobacteria bacterium]
MITTTNASYVIIISFVIATVMMLFPLPDFLIWWRPNWLLMVFIYWIIALPHRIGIVTGWMLGIISDVTLGSVLGVHGLTFALIAYLILIMTNRLRLFPLWKQSAIIALMVAFDLVLSLWIQNFIETQPRPATYWLPIISSAFLWPWIFLILRDIRRNFNVR